MSAKLSKRRFDRIISEIWLMPTRSPDKGVTALEAAADLISVADVYADDGAFLTARARAMEGVRITIGEVARLDQLIERRRKLEAGIQ